MMCLTSQPSTGSPSTSSYNLSTSGSASTSYTPYGSSPQNNPYFPFLGPPQLVAPPPGQPHGGFNSIQPSPIQQLHNFEQLNTENPAHLSNNAKKKGKNPNNNNPRLEGGNPQQNPPTGGKQNQGNPNPQGGNSNNQLRQGRKNNIRTNFPCALYGEYGHYTHHFPQIVDFKWMKESMNVQRPPASPAPQQAPQQYL
jgi:hypothetical protein